MPDAAASDRNTPARAGEADDAYARDDHVSGPRADHAPTGVDPEPTTAGTFKRMLKEVSEDNLTDWAATLTYYGVLSLFPALIALVSIVGLLFTPAQISGAVTQVLDQIAPGTAAKTFSPVIRQVAGSHATAGLGLVLGLAGALWTASGYVGAFTRAANVIWETPEGRPLWKLKPLQILITLIGVLFTALIAISVLISGPIVTAIAQPLGLGSAAVTAWRWGKWPVMVFIVAVMITVLYYMAPNVRQRGFRWVTPGAAFALLVWIVVSLAFGFYVANFGSYNKTYGTLAGVVVFLIWFWLTNLAVLMGAELNAERERTAELKAGIPRAEKEIQLDPRQEPKPRQTT
jgi:membrane protein